MTAAASDGDHLTLTRIRGHKRDLPGSGRWKIRNERSRTPHGDCWICDCKPYTLFFWNQDIGEHDELFFGSEDLKHVLKRIPGSGQDDALEKIGIPYVRGEFNNWEPQPMWEVTEFCAAVDTNKPNLLAMARERQIVSPSISDDKVMDYLTPAELRKMEKEVKAYRMQYKWNWSAIIQ